MLIIVTNRKLSRDDFLNRLEQIARGKPFAIMLREKDLSSTKYTCLARKVNEICVLNQVPLIINQHIEVAVKMKHPFIHLPLPDLRKYQCEIKQFTRIGASVHSVTEAKEAQRLGATYLMAGHIFATDCKKGVPPRGIDFLKAVCDAVTIPVFAIGGITKERVKDVLVVGAKGMCVMSEAMTCQNPVAFATTLLQESFDSVNSQ
jgi:thiamine-phosphate pyrophosphorylase